MVRREKKYEPQATFTSKDVNTSNRYRDWNLLEYWFRGVETYELIKSVRYDGVFAFMYSPRAGTPAAKMAGQIDQKIKNLRVNEVLACAKEFKKKEVENVTNQRKNIKNDGAISPN